MRQVDDPDEVVEHRPQVCTGCRAGLNGALVADVTRRQVFELPPLRVKVTEHRLLACRCRGCGAITRADAPAGVAAPAQYGPGLASVAVYLVVAHHLPVKRTVAIIADLLGVQVSTGWVATVMRRGRQVLCGFTDRVRELLKAASVVHFDESGLRVAGRMRWVHSASTTTLTWYHLDDKRGQTAIDTMGVLGGMSAPQVAVHDGWMPYLKPCYQNVAHALCNAHHLRELTGWVEHDPDQHAWAQTMIDLLLEGHKLVCEAKMAGKPRLEPKVLANLLDRWRKAVEVAYHANPPPAGKGRGKVLALVDRMDGFTTEIWRFAHNFTVPFDNNQAERDIRMVKLQQKISGGWRSDHGGRDWLRIRSYISTLRKNGIDMLTGLHDALTGNPWTPTTTPPATT